MTLVIFVRCQDGCLLIGDRKATDSLGYGTEEPKLKVFPRGWAIGGAGNAEPIQRLFYELDETGVTANSLEDIIVATFTEFCNSRTAEVSCILLKAQSQSVEAKIIEGSSMLDGSGNRLVRLIPPRVIDSSFKCIGEKPGTIVASHYMRKRDYSVMTCEQVAPEILAIMRQASREGSFVGRQEEFGFDMLLVKGGRYSYKRRERAEYVILTNEYHSASGPPLQFSYTEFENGGIA